MIRFNLKFKNINSGFTLLEALVAVSILMVAVVAPMTVAQKGLSSAVYAKNQMIASYLAQDAIEYIKNVRDQVAIRNNFDWGDLSLFGDTDTKTLCKSDDGCEIDTIKDITTDSSAVTTYSLVNPNHLWTDNINGFYGYTSGVGYAETIFTRQIKIALSDKPDSKSNKYEALVTVTVGWTGGNSVEVKTLIFNY
jgi:type II secretory pathway pseudopilin PulG